LTQVDPARRAEISAILNIFFFPTQGKTYLGSVKRRLHVSFLPHSSEPPNFHFHPFKIKSYVPHAGIRPGFFFLPCLITLCIFPLWPSPNIHVHDAKENSLMVFICIKHNRLNERGTYL